MGDEDHWIDKPPRNWGVFALVVVVAFGLAWGSGRLQPHFVPDSPSYLQYPFGSATAMARSIRTPGYPAWLWLVGRGFGVAAVPAAQVLLHAIAVFGLCREFLRWGLPGRQVLALGIAVAVGCTPTDHISTVASDALAASLGVMLVAAVMRWMRNRWPLAAAPPSLADHMRSNEIVRPKRGLSMVLLLGVAVIMVRPAYMFVVPWLFVVILIVGSMRGASWASATRTACQATVPLLGLLLAWMGFRFWAVGDFGMLPFGHQNLAGVLVQLLSDEELLQLSGDARPMAEAVVSEKQAFIDRGGAFAPGEPGATMTIDARWDDMSYEVVVPASARLEGDDTVAQHRAIASLNKAIVAHYPLRYLRWLVKAARRGAWGMAADIVMHPVFLLAIVAGGAMSVVRAARQRALSRVVRTTLALRTLTVITATYLAAKLGFVILSSPPIGRFSDAAAIFLPGWLAVIYLEFWFALPGDTPMDEPLAGQCHLPLRESR